MLIVHYAASSTLLASVRGTCSCMRACMLSRSQLNFSSTEHTVIGHLHAQEPVLTFPSPCMPGLCRSFNGMMVTVVAR